jgi:hypothetical protein
LIVTTPCSLSIVITWASIHIARLHRATQSAQHGIGAMGGDNPPLTRCVAGQRRDVDINIDGFIHCGMLPDFLQDIVNSGLSPDDLAPLFRSAYDYVKMWVKCGEIKFVYSK